MAVLVEYKDDIELPEGVTASMKDGTLVIKGPKGENQREFRHYKLQLNVKDGSVQ